MELWDIVTPSNLTRFSREVPQPQNLDLNRLPGGVFVDRTVNSFKPRIRTVTRTLSAAKFRVWNAENFVAKRPVNVTITELELPPLGQKLPILERELLELALADRDNENGDVAAQVYDDAETNVRATHARMELARGQLLSTGKVTINENGLVGLEADFGVAGDHKPTAGTLWSNVDDATPLTNERAWIQKMVDDGGDRPVVALTSQANADLLGRNAEYRTAYYGANQTVLPVLPTLNPDQVNEVRRRWNLPPIVINDARVDVDGTTTRIVDEDLFILIADGALETQWGLTAQALQVSSGGTDAAFTRRDAPGIFTAAYKSLEPALRETSTYAVGLPLLLDKTRIMIATVK